MTLQQVQRFLLQWDLAHRQQLDGRKRVHGALGLGIERAQGLDLLAIKLESDRHFRLWQEKIHHAAAPGELSRGSNVLHARVSCRDQEATKTIGAQGGTTPER